MRLGDRTHKTPSRTSSHSMKLHDGQKGGSIHIQLCLTEGFQRAAHKQALWQSSPRRPWNDRNYWIAIRRRATAKQCQMLLIHRQSASQIKSCAEPRCWHLHMGRPAKPSPRANVAVARWCAPMRRPRASPVVDPRLRWPWL